MFAGQPRVALQISDRAHSAEFTRPWIEPEYLLRVVMAGRDKNGDSRVISRGVSLS